MEPQASDKKFKWCKRILFLTCLVLFMRLFDLQILKGDEMRRLSEQNRVRIKKILAPRGFIFDRTGKVIADTRPSFNLYIIPEDIKDFTQTVDGLATLMEIDREEVVEKLKVARDLPSSFPVKIAPDMTMDQVAKVEANKFYLPGVTIQIEPKRNYPYGSMLSHALGYVSEISSDEMKSKDYKGYTPGDYIGKFGLERAYEKYLRGVDGEKRVEVDATGKEVRVLDTKEPVSGNSLYLNINMDLQQIVEKAFEGKKGGAIAADPRNGQVLILISKPSFDPNKLSAGISRDYWKTIATDKNHPLQNRVTQGRFPPGSTFKMVLALKALEEGILTEKTTFGCRGGFPFGNRVFRCWRKEGHGSVNVHRGIVESCDVFFYNTGLKLGIDRIHEQAEVIGLTKVAGIDLPGEKAGLVPSTEWKMKTYGEKWYEGETVSVSIGQGAVWVTPIGLMQYASFIGNEGVTFKPQIVNRIVSPLGKVVKVFEPVMAANEKLHKEAIAIVKEGMKGVVNEPRGTAYASRLQNIAMSGKTGTAQTVAMEKGKGSGDHAWFVAYAPSDAPSIAMSVLVEHGGHGASVAAPVAKAVTEGLLKEQIPVKSAGLREHR
jgi:penicillin-binding protein 2